MSFFMNNVSPDITSLAKSIQNGTATKEQLGSALQAMQIGMSTSLIEELGEASKPFLRLRDLQERLATIINNKLEALLQADSIDLSTAVQHLQSLQEMQYKVLDLKRKIVQGRELIPTSLLSEEERAVVKLFQSFSTKSEKEEFMKLVYERLSKLDTNE